MGFRFKTLTEAVVQLKIDADLIKFAEFTENKWREGYDQDISGKSSPLRFNKV